MSDGSLSQDEIDALLQGTDTVDLAAPPPAAATVGLSEAERAAFEALLAGVVESQSSNLSMLTGKTVRIEAPSVELVTPQQVAADLPAEVAEVRIDFTEALSGLHVYVLPLEAATRIAALMMGQEGVELDEVAYSTLGEAMSNIAGPAAAAMANQISGVVQPAAPAAQKKSKTELSLPSGPVVVKVEYPFTIEGELPSRLVELFDAAIVKQVTAHARGPAAARGATGAGVPGARPSPSLAPGFAGAGAPASGMGMPGGAPNVQPVQFPSLQPAAQPVEPGNIGLLMDVYMELTVELGRTRKLVKDILTIGEGSIIELDKLAGEPVDILVNHKLIAKGEVVVIDENFGVRVTEIVSQSERINDLGS